jgi:hypothetical protein
MTKRCANNRKRARRPGVSFVEVMVSAILVGVLMVAALGASGQAVLAQRMTADRATGQALAQGLLAEILQKRYLELGQSEPAIGIESDEDPVLRATFDDVDDYHAYFEMPPKLPDGTDIAAYSGWSRSVEVTWIDPVTLAPSGVLLDTGAKRISVVASRNGAPVYTAVGFRTSAP